MTPGPGPGKTGGFEPILEANPLMQKANDARAPMTTVHIGAREFRIGATYAPRVGRRQPRILVGFENPGRLGRPGGDVRVMTNNGYGDVWAGTHWLRWAGEEVMP